ncbi:Phosphoglycerate mutase-like protein [Madurella fahalii]|uniref:Phosphoglycerate mutase-like protein n=1 Tax=Madurella fahalii TaxID=1157608 RepID=A0ABQ0GJN3_9PEZI
MAPKVIVIRHAEGLHTEDERYATSPDPKLSPQGIKQCAELRAHLKESPRNTKVGLIITSPMRRALQTCMLALDFLVQKGTKIEANDLWQEVYNNTCDTGTPLTELTTSFPHVDFSRVDLVWPDKTSPAAAKYHYSRDAVLARAHEALRDLYHRREEVVIVVTHSGFQRAALGSRWIAHADYREFWFRSRHTRSDELGQPYQLSEHRASFGQESGWMGRAVTQEARRGVILPEEQPLLDGNRAGERLGEAWRMSGAIPEGADVPQLPAGEDFDALVVVEERAEGGDGHRELSEADKEDASGRGCVCC